jgi:hypothetical protein
MYVRCFQLLLNFLFFAHRELRPSHDLDHESPIVDGYLVICS